MIIKAIIACWRLGCFYKPSKFFPPNSHNKLLTLFQLKSVWFHSPVVTCSTQNFPPTTASRGISFAHRRLAQCTTVSLLSFAKTPNRPVLNDWLTDRTPRSLSHGPIRTRLQCLPAAEQKYGVTTFSWLVLDLRELLEDLLHDQLIHLLCCSAAFILPEIFLLPENPLQRPLQVRQTVPVLQIVCGSDDGVHEGEVLHPQLPWRTNRR